MIYYDTLLQNATDIVTKSDSYFIAKCDRILLQDATVITKMRRLLQIATINTHLGFNAIKMLKKISLAFLTQVET